MTRLNRIVLRIKGFEASKWSTFGRDERRENDPGSFSPLFKPQLVKVEL